MKISISEKEIAILPNKKTLGAYVKYKMKHKKKAYTYQINKKVTWVSNSTLTKN